MEQNQDKVKLVKFIPLSLTQKDPNNDNNLFKLSWSVRQGYPRMTVYLENPISNDKQKDKPFNYDTMIVAPFTLLTIFTFIENFKKVIDAENDTKYIIECYNSVFKDGMKVEGKIALQAKAVVGKDKNGIIYLAIVADEKRRAKLDILPDTRFFKFFTKNGKVIEDKKSLSLLHAKQYVKVLEKLMEDTLLEYGKSVEFRDKPSYKTTSVKNDKDNIDIDVNVDDIF